ncbi:MAG: hypothetical protein JWP81_2667 [Ferruginibacter sp.]|nr:hypothetical protein [Ferruginibacter sp.]
MFTMYSKYRLLKRMLKRGTKNKIDSLTDHFILPYREKFSGRTRSPRNRDEKHMNAHDLFNSFTADIIKEDAVFTR